MLYLRRGPKPTIQLKQKKEVVQLLSTSITDTFSVSETFRCNDDFEKIVRRVYRFEEEYYEYLLCATCKDKSHFQKFVFEEALK